MQKQEQVGYLKSALNLMQGTITLDENKLKLVAHKTGAGGFGLIGSLFKKQVEKEILIFDLPREEFSFTQGKHGVEKNVLVVTDKKGDIFKIIVKDYQEWASLLG